ncbi:MAG: trimeric intracellular cation channel family protein, partial [Hyphomicrobiales bacterium]
MSLDIADLVPALDRIGIVAFALSGVQVGARRHLDVFGLLVMGVVTATGGGLVRDALLVRVPFVLAHDDYLLWAVLSSAVAIAIIWAGRTMPGWIVALADAAGLGAFAAAGALAAIHADLELPAVLILAIVTATGGGVIRDLLADRVPLVLRSEVNATAAVLGG